MKIYDDLEGSGDWPEIDPQAIAESYGNRLEALTDHFGSHHPFGTFLPIGERNEQVELSAHEVEAIMPAEEKGKFVVHLKRELAEHKGAAAAVAITVTGAAVISAAAIHIINKKKKK